MLDDGMMTKPGDLGDHIASALRVHLLQQLARRLLGVAGATCGGAKPFRVFGIG
jgi:hypothetical protein